MEYKTVKCVIEDGVCTMVLNRPKEMNALDTVLCQEGLQLLAELAENEQVRVLVVKGEGRAFCAGGDLAEMKAGFDGNRGFYEHMILANKFTAALAEFPKPVIACVNGAATGAGMNVALAADIAIAAAGVKFSEIFGNVGLMPDMGGTYLLPRVVGRAKAKEIIFSYRMVTAEEALELGIVHKVVPAEQLEDAVYEMAKKMAKGPTFAFGLAKKVINRSFEIDLATALDMEAMGQALAMGSQDHAEGVKAFFEKRPPNFQGK